jgi:hypothetical protein
MLEGSNEVGSHAEQFAGLVAATEADGDHFALGSVRRFKSESASKDQPALEIRLKVLVDATDAGYDGGHYQQ